MFSHRRGYSKLTYTNFFCNHDSRRPRARSAADFDQNDDDEYEKTNYQASIFLNRLIEERPDVLTPSEREFWENYDDQEHAVYFAGRRSFFAYISPFLDDILTRPFIREGLNEDMETRILRGDVHDKLKYDEEVHTFYKNEHARKEMGSPSEYVAAAACCDGRRTRYESYDDALKDAWAEVAAENQADASYVKEDAPPLTIDIHFASMEEFYPNEIDARVLTALENHPLVIRAISCAPQTLGDPRAVSTFFLKKRSPDYCDDGNHEQDRSNLPGDHDEVDGHEDGKKSKTRMNAELKKGRFRVLHSLIANKARKVLIRVIFDDDDGSVLQLEEDCTRHLVRILCDRVNPKDAALTLLYILTFDETPGVSDVIENALKLAIIDEYSERFPPFHRLKVDLKVDRKERVRCHMRYPFPDVSLYEEEEKDEWNALSRMEETLYCALVLSRSKFFLDDGRRSTVCDCDALLAMQPREFSSEEEKKEYGQAAHEAFGHFRVTDPSAGYENQEFSTLEGLGTRIRWGYDEYRDVINAYMKVIPGEELLRKLAVAVQVPQAIVHGMVDAMMPWRARIVWQIYFERNVRYHITHPPSRNVRPHVSLAFGGVGGCPVM